MSCYQLLCGDSLEVIKTLPDRGINMACTSPPYFSLRDYGTAKWEGGDPNCDHQYQKGGRNPETAGKQLTNNGTLFSQYEHICKKCGAVRVDNQIGLEESPQQYVDRLVTVFHEMRRVLRDDGCLFLNIGDSYEGSGGPGSQYDNKSSNGLKGTFKKYDNPNRKVSGIKAKDVIGIPWMLAFALRDDGWWLRQELIWLKTNPMTESVQDRWTKAHEQIFFLTKSAHYYFDHEAIQEPAAYDYRQDEQYKGSIKDYEGVVPGNKPQTFAQNGHARWKTNENGTRVRNPRSVWTMNTGSFKGAHFATFPLELPTRCIIAGCPKNGTILDPFCGVGTTGEAALKLGCSFIGIDLNPDYIEMSRKRLFNLQQQMKLEI